MNHAMPFNRPAFDDRPEAIQLLDGIRARHSDLVALLDEPGQAGDSEDAVYRFYHQSFKVYSLQEDTLRLVKLFESLAPERPLNPWFLRVVHDGTGKTFEHAHNARWLEETRPILEAHAHARYFLRMMVKYGRILERPPAFMPSGWAAVLYLYGLR